MASRSLAAPDTELELQYELPKSSLFREEKLFVALTFLCDRGDLCPEAHDPPSAKALMDQCCAYITNESEPESGLVWIGHLKRFRQRSLLPWILYKSANNRHL